MPGLNIYTSNRLEILAEQLSRQLETPVSSAFAPEIIVIQSAGMERWISLELAKHNGICANIRYPFPNTFLDQIAKQVLPDDPERSHFDPDVLMFKIMQVLPECTQRPEFDRLKAYLADDTNHLKRLQLSSKLADIYDQYQVFRPELILRWEQNDDAAPPEEKWQAELWRKLLKNGQGPHRARRQQDLIEKIKCEALQYLDLPNRVFVFGISYLPLFHLHAFVALSQVVEMNIFLLNPCQEYWGDIVSEKQMQRIRRNYARSLDTPAELHLEEGNRLLASMGSQGKDFHTVISGFDFQMYESYQDPECTNMLACIQSDILNLRERRRTRPGPDDQNDHLAAGEHAPVFRIAESDRSIQIHSCHSPMRETEVLHDNLLAMFAEDPQLLPQDIVVMTPDIEIYAPYIQAVFEAQTDERLRIPFSIADQSARGQGRLLEGFFSFLDLKGSRFSVGRVMRLLEAPGVRQKFGLDRSDLDTVERWIRDTRIRWGIDDAHRRKLGLPAVAQNTWVAGIRRLLLGYAMPGNGRELFEGTLPYDDVEGHEIHSFGKFLDFIDAVFRYTEALSRPKTLQKWSTLLKRMLADFFRTDEDIQQEAQSLRSVLDGLGQRQADVAFKEKLELAPIRFYLGQQVDKLRFGSGFMTGGVTFCAMLPMRSIPFKVICLVGLNSDTFPRDFQPLSFDLIAKHPRPSDRSRRNDDKYLFLESIISARHTLYISYVGQSSQDNSKIPPSVLVSELMDTIEKGFDLPGKSIREHVLHVHRLQAFSPQYFKKSGRLFSYSAENCDAAAFLPERKQRLPLITRRIPLTPPEKEALHDLDTETLCRFFSHPTRFLLQRRLGIALEQKDAVTEKREDFELNHLNQYLVGQNLARTRLAGNDLNLSRAAQLAMGQFPHGSVGTLCYNQMSAEVEQFVTRTEPMQQKKIADPMEARIDIGDFRLLVHLPEIYDHGLVQIRYANQRAQDLLRLWVYHLAFCAVAQKDWPHKSVYLFKDSTWQFDPIDQPHTFLTELLDMLKLGLEKPLHLFPTTSLEYIQQQQIYGMSEKTAMVRARQKWVGSDFARGESDDPYYDVCFKMTDPLDASFAAISRAVFEPLLKYGTAIMAGS